MTQEIVFRYLHSSSVIMALSLCSLNGSYRDTGVSSRRLFSILQTISTTIMNKNFDYSSYHAPMASARNFFPQTETKYKKLIHTFFIRVRTAYTSKKI
jgi:hypothetical protein